MLNYLIVGQKIRDFRKLKRLSQETLAEKVDKSVAYISYIEGGYKCMSVETLVDIVNALGITADVLLSECLEYNFDINAGELKEIIEDCSPYERKIILDTARAIKISMRDNLSMSRKKSY